MMSEADGRGQLVVCGRTASGDGRAWDEVEEVLEDLRAEPACGPGDDVFRHVSRRGGKRDLENAQMSGACLQVPPASVSFH